MRTQMPINKLNFPRKKKKQRNNNQETRGIGNSVDILYLYAYLTEICNLLCACGLQKELRKFYFLW